MSLNGQLDDVVKEFDSLDSATKELINAAIDARTMSYSPYSNFKVGAALRTEDGQIYKGCNIENGAYSPTICAERTAAVKAISEGKLKFTACAVVAYQEESFTTPCGVCRQFLSEFAGDKDFPIYVTKPTAYRVLVTSVHKLLPMGFTPMKN